MRKQIEVISELQTKKLGEIIGKFAEKQMVITMSGDLGAGKTTMTKGIASGLDITKVVTSPTFTICKIYNGRLPLYHFDAYRLENSHEDLGFEELLCADGLSVVEWPEYFKKELMNIDTLDIVLSVIDEDIRLISFEASNEKYDKIIKELIL
ncbi:MAG: tRNA (adenosine(37)-N6)-threonylcarbamoyltransferase complex ATPase subunit type 1 TsaE [Anaerorhabdus sp.]